MVRFRDIEAKYTWLLVRRGNWWPEVCTSDTLDLVQ